MGSLLYGSDTTREAASTEEVLRRLHKQFDCAALERIDSLVDRVNDCASCEGWGTHLIVVYIAANGAPLRKPLRRAMGDNRWEKRAAAAALVVSARRDVYPDRVFIVADALLPVRDYMVDKGVGSRSVLKQETKAPGQAAAVAPYLVPNRNKASRLRLGYAWETRNVLAARKKRVLG